MQWHAPFLSIKLLNRSPQIARNKVIRKTHQFSSTLALSAIKLTIGIKRVYWELCSIEHLRVGASSWSHFFRQKWPFEDSILTFEVPQTPSTIKSFFDSRVCDQQQISSPSQETDDTIRVTLSFKDCRDLISADNVRKQVKDLILKVHTTIPPVFVSRKIELNENY